MNVEKYLDQEGCIDRTTEEIDEFIRTKGSQELFNTLHIVRSGQWNEGHTYNFFSQTIDGVSIFDHQKGRSRLGIEWLFGKLSNIVECLNPQRILDIGCGTGLESVFLAKSFPNINVVGIDRIKEMISVAETRKRKYSLNNVNFLVGDAYNLPVEKESFDLALFMNVLEVLDDYGSFDRRIQQSYNALRPGGAAIVKFALSGEENLEYHVDETSIYLRNSGFQAIGNDSFRFRNIDGRDFSYVIISGEKI
ncbi:class I SAM-dependent methyltransferase [Candidatus Pacearchaeota archaeon]|nr:class I SAM-dependent methyltransferase [Candidatus Pacearchaeota archaeon]